MANGCDSEESLLAVFGFAIFKGSIFFLAPTEGSSSPPSCLLPFKAPGCVGSCSQGVEPQGLLGEGLTVGMCVFLGEAAPENRGDLEPTL